MRRLATLVYHVKPEDLSQESVDRVADLLSGYAADIRKHQTWLPVGHTISFYEVGYDGEGSGRDC